MAHIAVVLVINVVLLYISAAILCSIMFRRDAKKWSWLNLIIAVVCTLLWVFAIALLTGSAARITFGIIFFLICWGLWVLVGGISERRAIYAAAGTLLIWFLLSWIFMVIMYAFNISYFTPAEFPTLIGWLP